MHLLKDKNLEELVRAVGWNKRIDAAGTNRDNILAFYVSLENSLFPNGLNADAVFLKTNWDHLRARFESYKTLVLQHSSCIMYYWLFYVPAIYLYCTMHSPSTLFLQ